MPNTLQASKDEPTLSLEQTIEAMNRENGRLRAEFAYRQKLQELGEELRRDVDYVIDRCNTAVVTLRRFGCSRQQTRLDELPPEFSHAALLTSTIVTSSWPGTG